METIKERLQFYIDRFWGGNNAKFEREANLGNGYTKNIKASIGSDKLQQILQSNPDLNVYWLLLGAGEMLKTNQSVGDINGSSVSGVNVNGNDIHINPDAYDTLLKIVHSNQKTTEKFQEQIDRLITVIECRNNNKK